MDGLRVRSLRRRAPSESAPAAWNTSRAELFRATTRIALSMTTTPSRMLSIVTSKSAAAGTSPEATAAETFGKSATAGLQAYRAAHASSATTSKTAVVKDGRMTTGGLRL